MMSIVMKNSLEPIIVDEEFHGALRQLNEAAATGKNFAVMDKPDGLHVMIYIPNIDSIDELES